MKSARLVVLAVLLALTAACRGQAGAPDQFPLTPTPIIRAFQPSPAPRLPTTAAVFPFQAPKTSSNRRTARTRTPKQTRTPSPNYAATVVAVSPPKLLAEYPSPNGAWQAQIITRACDQDKRGGHSLEQLQLVNLTQSDGSIKTVDQQLINCGGLGAFGLVGRFWSPNSRFFYYSDAREGVPDGCGYWVRRLKRVDAQNLAVDTLGGGPISPDQTKLATWHYEGKKRYIVVWDINAGEIARAEAAVSVALEGSIVWSPDSQSLVYLQTADFCAPVGKTFGGRLDLPHLQLSRLFGFDSPGFVSVRWETPQELLLQADGGAGQWRYDFTTKQLTLVTPAKSETRAKPTTTSP